MKYSLKQIAKKIKPLDTKSIEKMRRYHQTLLMPKGALRVPLSYVEKLSGIYRKTPVGSLQKKRVVLFAADHGIAQEGISAYPQEVTEQMLHSFANNWAVITALSKQQHLDVTVVDLGVKGKAVRSTKILSKKIAQGTKNFFNENAMTKGQRNVAIALGIQVAEDTKKLGYDIALLGEMGIGNSSSASAITASLLHLPPKIVTGRGSGIDAKTYRRKITRIEKALLKRAIDLKDPFDVIEKVGGFEIAGMTGFLLGAAMSGLPVILDGFITGAAALLAYTICPISKQYWIAGHVSAEIGHTKILEFLNLLPILDLDLRLGEASGAAFALPVLEQAIAVSLYTGTFQKANVSNKK